MAKECGERQEECERWKKENRDLVSQLDEAEKRRKGLDDGVLSLKEQVEFWKEKESRATNSSFELEEKVNKQWEEVERRWSYW